MPAPLPAKTRDADPVWIVVGESADLGLIDEMVAKRIGCVSATIRLAEGFEKNSKGYGLRHIEANANRVAQIKGLLLGIRTVKEFVALVARQWTKVVKAEEEGRLALVHSIAGYDLKIVVQMHTQGTRRYWSVVTAIPGRRAKPADVIFEKEKPVG